MYCNEIMITERDKLISEDRSVAEAMDNYFVNIANSLNLKNSPESNNMYAIIIMHSFLVILCIYLTIRHLEIMKC